MRRVFGIVKAEYAHRTGCFGQGIVVAVVDSGIGRHRDFAGCPAGSGICTDNRSCNRPYNRLTACVDMVNHKKDFYDDNGHGTHVAGIIGGYGNRFTGIAPACKFVSVKVLDRFGNGKLENVIEGLNWILENKDAYDIRLVNISVGTGADKEYRESSELVKKVDELWNAGLIVLAAAGNNGPERGSIGAPGISRRIITVGALDENSRRTTGIYSGCGPTRECIKKPDIVAPGSHIISCGYVNGRDSGYCAKSGTSMATPVVTGAIADILSYNSHLTGKDVKILLKNTARDMGYPHERQGWGMLDIEALFKGTFDYEKNDKMCSRYFKK